MKKNTLCGSDGWLKFFGKWLGASDRGARKVSKRSFSCSFCQCESSESVESDSSESSINGKNFDGVNGILRALPGSEAAAACS